MTTADELRAFADRREREGAHPTAVAILRRAAEFAATQFGQRSYQHQITDADEDAHD